MNTRGVRLEVCTGNRHTIIATETMARMLWAVISDEQLGAGQGVRGY
ncbi:MAG: hypothetical protein AB1450_08875 [Pseudomonadota bacterium]